MILEKVLKLVISAIEENPEHFGEYNKTIEYIKNYPMDNEDVWINGILEKVGRDFVLQIIEFGYNGKFLSQEEYFYVQELIGTSENKDIVNNSEEDSVEKLILNNKQREDCVSRSEIEDYIAKGYNLYHLVPGDKIPRESLEYYAEIFLLRFIDCGKIASDFTFETQGIDKKVYIKNTFIINGENITQYETPKVDLKFKENLEKRRDDGELTEEEVNDIIEKEPFNFITRVFKYIVLELPAIANPQVNEDDIPSDTSFTFTDRRNGKLYDFRGHKDNPISFGEYFPGMVTRLATESNTVSLDKLYIIPHIKSELKSIGANTKEGLVAITGPTGSGKTTTLDAMINMVDKERVRIKSFDDPIESYNHGVNQTQLSRDPETKKLRYGHEDFTKSVMRSAVKVVKINEMRDKDDVKATINISLSGHKTYTTYHTKSPVGAIKRMEGNGVSIVDIAQGFDVIIAQRLVGELCPNCKIESIDYKREQFKDDVERLYRNPRRFLENKLNKILDSIEDEYFNYTDLDMILEKEISKILSEEDITNIIRILKENKSYLNNNEVSILDKKESIKKWLKDYPNPVDYKFHKKLFQENVVYERNEQGCDNPNCSEGHIGRIAVYEIFLIDRTMREYLENINSLSELTEFNKNRGTVTMKKYISSLILEGKVDVNLYQSFE